MTLETIRKEAEKNGKRRRRLNAACSMAVIASLCVAAYGAAGALPYYLEWRNTCRQESRSIGEVETPAYVTVRVGYTEGPPSGLALRHADTGQVRYGAEVSVDEQARTVTLSQEMPPDMPSGEYELVLAPGRNSRLSVETDIEPSYRYVAGTASAYRSADGRRVDVSLSYGRCINDDGMRLSATLTGPGYAVCVYDEWLGASADVSLCLEDLARQAGADLTKATSLSLAAYAPYHPPEGWDAPPAPAASWRWQAELSRWPDEKPEQR